MKPYKNENYHENNLIAQYIQTVKKVINDPETCQKSRKREEDFTRSRRIGFTDLLCVGLQNSKATNAKVANFYLQEIKEGVEPISRQAFSQARAKFDFTPYLMTFEKALETCLENIDELKTIYGYIPVAYDGMQIPLPKKNELIEVFGTSGKGDSAATARSSFAYMPLDELILDAQIGPFCEGERQMASFHTKTIEEYISKGFFKSEQVLILADRGYPSKDFIDDLENSNLKYVMRCRSNFTLRVSQAPMGLSKIKTFEGQEYNVYKFLLSSGQLEVLITNTDLTSEQLEKVYFLRWGIETENNVIKNKLTLTDFSGYKANSILQDFFAALVVANLVNIIAREAQTDIEANRENSGEDNKKENKHLYKANKNEIVGTLSFQLLRILMTSDTEKIKERIRFLYNSACKHVIAVVQGRSYPRPKRPNSNKRSALKRNT